MSGLNLSGLIYLTGYAGDQMKEIATGLRRVGEQKNYHATYSNFKGMKPISLQLTLIDQSSDCKRQIIEIEVFEKEGYKNVFSTLVLKDNEMERYYPARYWINGYQEDLHQNSIFFQEDAMPAFYFEDLQANHALLIKNHFTKMILK